MTYAAPMDQSSSAIRIFFVQFSKKETSTQSLDKNQLFFLKEARNADPLYNHLDKLRQEFSALVKIWKLNTSFLSSIDQKTADPAYAKIIEMGRPIIPILLSELARIPDHWFKALAAITKENPVENEDRGRIREMTTAWLEWGEREGY